MAADPKSSLRARVRDVVAKVGHLGREDAEEVVGIALDLIVFNPDQPRKYFSEAGLEDLARSIQEKGVLQPILVRPSAEGRYELVIGERRVRASRLAGLTLIPGTIRELSDEEALEIGLIENLQREDINPVEEVDGYLRVLRARLKLSQEEIITLLGKMWWQYKKRAGEGKNVFTLDVHYGAIEQIFSAIGGISWQSFYSVKLRVLKLAPEVLLQVRSGRLDYTKGLEVGRVSDPPTRQALLERVLAENLSVAQIKAEVSLLRNRTQMPSLARRLTQLTQKVKRLKMSGAQQQELEESLAEIESKIDALLNPN